VREDLNHAPRTYGLIRFEKLNIKNMTARANPKPDQGQPGTFLKNGRAAKAGLNRATLAQGWGVLVCDAVPADGSRRSRARAKPTSSACPAGSPVTPMRTQQTMSRQDRAGSPSLRGGGCQELLYASLGNEVVPQLLGAFWTVFRRVPPPRHRGAGCAGVMGSRLTFGGGERPAISTMAA
jgi:hypothetical protein